MIKFGVEQQGIFTLKIVTKSGEEKAVVKTNLILDNGFSGLFTGNSVIRYISIGTDNTPTNINQTELLGKISHISTSGKLTHGKSLDNTYGWTIATVEFPNFGTDLEVGEAGIGWDGTNLWSRVALDEKLTVKSDDNLVVQYELRSWWITPAPYEMEYQVKGQTYTTTVTSHQPLRDGATRGASAFFIMMQAPFYLGRWLGRVGNVYNFSVQIPLNENNDVSQIRGFHSWGGFIVPVGVMPPFTQTIATGQVAVSFNPPLVKRNDYQLNIFGQITLGRKQ